MAKAKSSKKRSPAWRILRWTLVLILWRLPRMVCRLLAFMFRAMVGLITQREAPPEAADNFYRSHQWRRLRVDILEANRQRYGLLACECCGMVNVASFHVDHIYPRSTHPELALDPANLQVLCDACNIGKGTAYTTNWRGGDGPSLPKRGLLQRLFVRS